MLLHLTGLNFCMRNPLFNSHNFLKLNAEIHSLVNPVNYLLCAEYSLKNMDFFNVFYGWFKIYSQWN